MAFLCRLPRRWPVWAGLGRGFWWCRLYGCGREVIFCRVSGSSLILKTFLGAPFFYIIEILEFS
jgi:hypothetical protein